LLRELTRPWAPSEGSTVVAAVSGGADSVAVGLLLAALAPGRGWTVAFATLDHGLRGDAGARDRAFVERLAETEGLACHSAQVEAGTARSGSDELAAREARRAFLLQLAHRTGGVIALGHTLDDQAETVLYRLARGTGLAGTGAMRRWSPPLWRPALGIRRATLRELLRAWDQPWVEDETNRSQEAARNRLRQRVLPALERAVDGGAAAGLARAAELADEDDRLLVELARERSEAVPIVRDAGGIRLSRKELAKVPAPLRRRLFRAWFDELSGGVRLASAHLLALDALAEAESPGTAVDLPGGYRARRGGGWLRLERPTGDRPGSSED
jgi:tRNA(Ile)-lysidine synthase